MITKENKQEILQLVDSGKKYTDIIKIMSEKGIKTSLASIASYKKKAESDPDLKPAEIKPEIKPEVKPEVKPESRPEPESKPKVITEFEKKVVKEQIIKEEKQDEKEPEIKKESENKKKSILMRMFIP